MINAWHGTPHKVDKFSLKYAGRGEGAHTYGWGLYFASEKKVAEHYQIALGGEESFINSNGIRFNVKDLKTADPEMCAIQAVGSVGYERAKAWINEALDDGGDITWGELFLRFVEIHKDAKREDIPNGNLYAVDINVEPDRILLWDKKLSEQSAFMQEGVRVACIATGIEVNAKKDIGQTFYERLSFFFDSNPRRRIKYVGEFNSGDGKNSASDGAIAASRFLFSECGIQGIAYLDAVSREFGLDGTNYVMFDDSTISAHRGDAPLFSPEAGEERQPQKRSL